VPPHVAAPLGEDQAGLVGPAIERNEDRRVLAPMRVETLRFDRSEEGTGQLRVIPTQMIT
jgi:hypothetical protein